MIRHAPAGNYKQTTFTDTMAVGDVKPDLSQLGSQGDEDVKPKAQKVEIQVSYEGRRKSSELILPLNASLTTLVSIIAFDYRDASLEIKYAVKGTTQLKKVFDNAEVCLTYIPMPRVVFKSAFHPFI